MWRLALRRLVELVLVLLIVSFVAFWLASKLPGDPAITLLGPHRPAAAYQRLRHQLGLDQSLVAQWWNWLTASLRGDLGRSLLPPRPTVASMVSSALPVTLEIVFMALAISLAISVPAALWSARHANRVVDRSVTASSFALLSMPEFLGGLLLILMFVVVFRALPRLGWVPFTDDPGQNLRHAILPALALALPQAALFTQVLRNDLVTTLQEDFILAARATGEQPWRILVQDALRPSMFSLATVAGVSVGYLVGGTAVIETQFDLPGMGSLLVNAAGGSDVPVLLAAVIVLATTFVVVNTVIDIGYSLLDPRVRHDVVGP
jgi:peptide/nickel transport system permease protein